MKAVKGRGTYFLIAMAMLSLLLAGVLLWEWERGMDLKRELLKMRKIPVTAVPPQKILPEFSLPNLETGFPELLARPVFSISRRPFVSSAQADAGAMKKGQFALVGVLISPGRRSALLRDVATGKTQTVAQSGLARGMTLGEVQPNRVVLRQGDETEELLLNVLTGPKVVPPQRTLVAPTPPPAMPSTPTPTVPRPAASSALPAAATIPASAPKPLTAQELIQAEKNQQAALEQMKKQGPSVPPSPPPAAAPK